MEQQNTQVDISKLTIEQLKALAYDEIIKLENAKNNLAILQNEINKRVQGV
jgi:hypothetical protein